MMRLTEKEHDALMQCLADAGCGQELISRCCELRDAERTPELLRLLACRRTELLDGVHSGQDRLDCLDYLIYQIKKQ